MTTEIPWNQDTVVRLGEDAAMADVAVAERPPSTRASNAVADAGSDHLEDTLGASSLRDGLSDEDSDDGWGRHRR